MKILIIAATSFMLSSDTTYVVKGVCINTELEKQMLSSYCEGFKDGFEDGYCYQVVGCIPPIPPTCPIAGVNEEKNYKGGYKRGFVTGRKSR